MAWLRVSTVVPAELAHQLADALEEQEAIAVTLADAEDEPVYEPTPGTTPLWQATRVEALFTEDADWERATQLATAMVGSSGIAWQVDPLADQVWERAWMDRFKPMRFGDRLWICPSAHPVPDEAEVVVKLDPGLAFGTGTHPTTHLCLEALDAMQTLPASVIDYGCGSGVLAVAALLLGTQEVQCVDIDPQALTATVSNAEVNGVESNIRVSQKPAELEPAELVLANILAGPLTELAPQLAELTKPGGTIVLSGILETQAEELLQTYSAWFDMQPVATMEDWARLIGTRHRQ